MDFQNRMIPVIKGNGFNPLNFSKNIQLALFRMNVLYLNRINLQWIHRRINKIM